MSLFLQICQCHGSAAKRDLCARRPCTSRKGLKKARGWAGASDSAFKFFFLLVIKCLQPWTVGVTCSPRKPCLLSVLVAYLWCLLIHSYHAPRVTAQDEEIHENRYVNYLDGGTSTVCSGKGGWPFLTIQSLMDLLSWLPRVGGTFIPTRDLWSRSLELFQKVFLLLCCQDECTPHFSALGTICLERWSRSVISAKTWVLGLTPVIPVLRRLKQERGQPRLYSDTARKATKKKHEVFIFPTGY